MHGDTIESNKRSCPFKSDMIWAYDLGVSSVVIANPSLCLRRPAPCVFRCMSVSRATCMSACCVKCWWEHSPLLLEHLPSYVIYERVDQNKAKVWVGASTEPTRLTKEPNMMIHQEIMKSPLAVKHRTGKSTSYLTSPVHLSGLFFDFSSISTNLSRKMKSWRVLGLTPSVQFGFQ